MDIRGSWLADPRCLDLRCPRCSGRPAHGTRGRRDWFQGRDAPRARVMRDRKRRFSTADGITRTFGKEPPDPPTDKKTAALVAILHAHATIYGSFTVPRVTGPKGGQSATIV